MSGPPGPPFPPNPAPGSNAIGQFQVGVSPVGTIAPFSYWQTVISQFGNSPIIGALIGNFDAYLDQTANMDLFYDNVFDVATANGPGLDACGRVVGVTRVLTLAGTQKYVGFNEASDPSFNSGFPFYSGVPSTQNYALPDPNFRTLVYAKMLSNLSNGSSASINQILLALFPGRGNCYVVDVGGNGGANMTMTYHFNFPLSPVELAIVSQSGVLPKPVGVAASVVHL
jgi:hypothetical protein